MKAILTALLHAVSDFLLVVLYVVVYAAFAVSLLYAAITHPLDLFVCLCVGAAIAFIGIRFMVHFYGNES